MNDLSVAESEAQVSDTRLQKDNSPSTEQENLGLERFLNSLDLPTKEEQEKLNDRLTQVEVDYDQWNHTPWKQRNFDKSGSVITPPTPRDVYEGKDPESQDLIHKEANFLLKELCPQIVGNILKILDKIPNIDKTNGTKEFFTKRTADLKFLLNFSFVPEGRPMTLQEQRQLRCALSIIEYMTDQYVVGNDIGGLYKKGMDQLTKQLKPDESHIHSTKAQRPYVVEQLGEHAGLVNEALKLSYGLHIDKSVPHLGMIDGSGNGREYDTLTFYARRVDPQFYMDLEDQMMGLVPNSENVEKPDSRPVVKPHFG